MAVFQSTCIFQAQFSESVFSSVMLDSPTIILLIHILLDFSVILEDSDYLPISHVKCSSLFHIISALLKHIIDSFLKYTF